MLFKKNLLLQVFLLWFFSLIFTIAFENLLTYFTQLSKYTILILNALLMISMLCLVNHKYKLTKIFIRPAHDTWLDKLVYTIPIILYSLRAVSIFFDEPTLLCTIANRIPHYLIILLVVVTSTFFEEYLVRGLIFGSFLVYFKQHYWRVQLSILFSAFIFSLSHLMNLLNQNPLQTLSQMIYTFGFGCLLSMLYIRSRSLLIPFITHFLLTLPSFLDNSSLSATHSATPKSLIGPVCFLIVFLTYTFIFINKDEEQHYQF